MFLKLQVTEVWKALLNWADERKETDFDLSDLWNLRHASFCLKSMVCPSNSNSFIPFGLIFCECLRTALHRKMLIFNNKSSSFAIPTRI